MFKTFRLLCEIWSIIMFVLSLLVVSMLFFQTANVTPPEGYMETLSHIFAPLLDYIRLQFNPEITQYNDHKIDGAYSVLTAFFIGGFILCLFGSALLNRLDIRWEKTSSRWTKKFFDWKLKWGNRNIVLTKSGKLYMPESGALMALKVENTSNASLVQDCLDSTFSRLSWDQKMYTESGRYLLQFPSTLEAYKFAARFYADFNQAADSERFNIGQEPTFKISVQTVATPNGYYEEDSFIWALLSCVGTNEIYSSAESVEQFEMKNQSLKWHAPFDFILVGTFSNLGPRTFTDVYRLSYKKELFGLDEQKR